jgi:DNA repair protein RecN (Recombination protein N)
MGLRRLMLKDFVIVPALELDVAEGFTVLTGETGAGKSILIDALQLLLGGRGDALVVREGAPRCEVSAEFDTPAALHDWLIEHGLEHDGTLLMRRTVDTEGRSRAWINGSAATLAQLKHAGSALIDIHGQHAWQSLTRPDTVRALLDGYGKVSTQALRQAHSAWHSAHQHWQAALQRQDSLREEHERLQWQINEIGKLAPHTGEWEELNQRHKQLAHAQALIDGALGAAQALEDDEPSAAQLIDRALHQIEPLLDIDPRFGAPTEALRSALAQVQDAAHSLKQLGHHTDQDPDALQALDERLALWMSLTRRYRCGNDELPALWQRWQTDLQGLESAQDIAALEQEAKRLHTALTQQAKAVTQQRQRAAHDLAAAVTHAMQTLGMSGGRFDVALHPLDAIAAVGAESVEFLVAGHPGASPKPVGKVASGGELSRIALAISVVTSQLGSASTLIFDEVDAGIGGQVAHTVGALLRQLGADRQVLAVTHLAQVAACGHQHWRVSKGLHDGRTVSQLTALHGEDRVRELARMLDGKLDSAVSLAHARELLHV